MYNSRYFAPRYFAPRYFPEAGADSPPIRRGWGAMMPSIRLVLLLSLLLFEGLK